MNAPVLIELGIADSAPDLEFTVLRRRAPVDLTGCFVFFTMRHESTGDLVVDRLCQITNASAGRCTYNWRDADLAAVGRYVAQLRIIYPDGARERTRKMYLHVEEGV